jgi:hypothetical protein
MSPGLAGRAVQTLPRASLPSENRTARMTAGDQRECEDAGFEVLRLSQDAGGDIAAGNDGVLHTLDHDANAARSQATACR